MAVINTNVKALFSQAALKSTERNQSIAMQQLSTGKRINSARDDAAGMAISTRMTHQIRSLNMAVRNAGDAISLIQTAEGATNEITDMLNRMRELAVQAVNDTNDNSQRSYLDLEFQQLKQEIVHISDSTEWNGFPVLNGSAGERVGEMPLFKVTSQNLTGSVFIQPTSSRTLGGDGSGEKQTLEISGTAPFATGTIKVAGVSIVVDTSDTVSISSLATKIQQTLSNSGSFNESSGRSVSLSGSSLTINYSAADGNIDPIQIDTTAITNSINNLTITPGDLRQAITQSKELFKDNGTFIRSGSLSVNMSAAGQVTANFLTETGQVISMKGIYNSSAATESSSVTFKDLVAYQTVSLGGLTYTAGSAGATASEVATDFLNRSNYYSGGTVSSGTFTGQLNGFSTATSISTGTTSEVVFTSASSGANVKDLAISGSGDLPDIITNNGAPGSSISFYKSMGSNSQIISNDLTYTFQQSDDTPAVLDNRDFNLNIYVAGSIPPLRAGDLKINDIDIGASYANDDKVSPPNNASGSAIAKAAAINRKAVATGITHGETQNIIISGTPLPGTIVVGGVSVSLNALDTNSAAATAKIASALQASPLFSGTTGRLVTYIPGNSNLSITYAPSEGNIGDTNINVGSTGLVGIVDTTSEAFTSSAGTGVFAKVNENVMTGQAMTGISVLSGAIFVNGFASANVTTVLNNPRETRANTVKAINLISDKTGVKAVDTGSDTKGVTLIAADGRNIEVSFETAADANDFGARIGMHQGVQASTVSLESKIPTPVLLSSDSTGDITRAGLLSGNYSRNQAVTDTIARPVVAPSVAQVDSVTFTGAATVGDKYSLTINGNTFSYTAQTGGLTEQKIRDGLVSLVNASSDVTVTAKAGRNKGEILFLSDMPGTSFTLNTSKSQDATTTVSNFNVIENARADYKPLGQDDLVINGVKIPASNAKDDEYSSTLISSSDRSASALAIAAAINTQTALTAVRAEANGAEIKGGGPLNTNLPALSGTTKESLYVNGTKIDVEFVQGENADVRRNKVVEAINLRTGQHGVTAQNNGNGVSLASDGRNMSVWFDSNVKDLSADSFGLNQGGAVAQVSRINFNGDVTISDTAQVKINGVTITSANPSPSTLAGLSAALATAISNAISSGALKNISVDIGSNGMLEITSTIPGAPFEVIGASVSAGSTTSVGMVINEVTANSLGNNLVTGIRGGNENSTTAMTAYGTVRMIAQAPQLPGLPIPIGAPPSDYEKLLRANGKPFTISAGSDGFGKNSNFSFLGFNEGTYGGRSSSDMDPPKVGRLAFQVGSSANQMITIDLADFGKNGPITASITGDVDQNVESRTVRINTRDGASAVLSKLDAVMDNVNATRATMGAVMNRLDHVISNLTNVSMNLSASRSQIEDADYASASTEMAKNQIMQQAGTAVLAQANTSQQSVLKLLGG